MLYQIYHKLLARSKNDIKLVAFYLKFKSVILYIAMIASKTSFEKSKLTCLRVAGFSKSARRVIKRLATFSMAYPVHE